MKILRLLLAEFLRRSQIKVELTGFDVEGFTQSVCWVLSRKLDEIRFFVYEREMTDEEKVEAIRECLERERI